MSRQYLLRHCRLATNDLDEARANVNHLWERHTSSLRHGQDYGLRWHQAELAGASLSYIENASELRVQSVVGQRYHLTFCEEGGAVHRVEGREAVISPTNLVIHTPGQKLELDLDPFQALHLSFNASFAEKMLQRRGVRVPAPDSWPVVLPGEVPSVATLRSLCQWVGHELDRAPSYLPNASAVRAGLERMLLTLFMDALAEFQPPTTPDPGRLGAAQLKLIDDWLDSNYAELITVDDLAKVAGVSVRALQATYKRVRGYTPKQAIQQRRLDAARRQLLSPGPQTTVTDVALDCGFLHLGRFAAVYKSAYGEAPSQTLAASRMRVLGAPPVIVTAPGNRTSNAGNVVSGRGRAALVRDRLSIAGSARSTLFRA